jgi:TP901 family phage tail tape measure protein
MTENVGIKFVAENDAAFFSAIEKNAKGLRDLTGEALGASKNVSLLNDATRKALSIETLTEKLQTQQKSLAVLRQELAQTAQKYGETSTAAQKKAIAVEKAENAIRQTQRNLGALQQTLIVTRSAFDESANGAQKWGSVVERASNVVDIAMGNIAAEAATALVSFAKDGLKAAGDFEAGMLRFGSVTGSSLADAGMDLEQFKQIFLDAGSATQYSAAQAQDAAINLAKGGIQPAIIAAGGLESALALAAAGELDLATAAEITAKQYGVWVDATAPAEKQAQQIAESTDLLAQAANASTVDVDNLALGLANVGQSAKIGGLSLRETVTTMAMLSPGFSSAADAGTSFKTFLARMVPTTKAASDAFADLGLLTEQGTSVFYDASGAFVGMEKASQLLNEALAPLSEQQKQVALNAAFGSDAIRAAAIIAENGAEGYNAMTAAMGGAGTALEQATARNQGFNFALDSLLGSMETFGIVAGSLFLPVLTTIIETALIPAFNALTAVAGSVATFAANTGMTAAVLQDVALPALIGVTTALTLYASTQLTQAIPAIIAMIPQLVAQTAAFITNAAAVAAAAAPYALIAAAIGGVVYAYQDLQTKLAEGNTKLLENQGFWQRSSEAMQNYKNASKETQEVTQGHIATQEALRAKIAEQTESLSKRMTTGSVSEAQYHKEIEAIRANGIALDQSTQAMNAQIEAHTREQAALATSQAALTAMGGAHAPVRNEILLTAEELQKLEDKLVQTYERGGQAVGTFVATEVDFLGEAEDRRATYGATIEKLQASMSAAVTADQKQAIQTQIDEATRGYAEQEAVAAAAYANQQAAQRAALGVMLQEYVTNQALMGRIGTQEAAQLQDAIATEYGLMADQNQATFLRMTDAITQWAENNKTSQAAVGASAQEMSDQTNTSIQTLIGKLNEQEAAAVATEEKMREYSKEYVATAVANFVEKGQEADEYARKLRNIPTQVSVRIKIDADPIPEHVKQQSPSPLEQSLIDINEAALNVETEGMPSFNRAMSTVTPVAQRTITSITGALRDGDKTVSTQMVQIGTHAISSFERSTDDESTEAGKTIIQSLADGMEIMAPYIEDMAGKISGELIEKFESVGDAIKQLITDIIDVQAGAAGVARGDLDTGRFLTRIADPMKKANDEALKNERAAQKEYDTLVKRREELAQRIPQIQARLASGTVDENEIRALNDELAAAVTEFNDPSKIDAAQRRLFDATNTRIRTTDALARAQKIQTDARAELATLQAEYETNKQIDPRAAQELYNTKTAQLRERTEAQIAISNAYGTDEADRLQLEYDTLKDVQQRETSVAQQRFDNTVNNQDNAQTNLVNTVDEMEEALNERFAYEDKIARTGQDDKGKRYNNKDRERYRNAAQYTGAFLEMFRGFAGGVRNAVRNGQAFDTAAFQRMVDQYTQFMGNKAVNDNLDDTSRAPDDPLATDQSRLRAPPWWPSNIYVPSDVNKHEGRVIPARWAQYWQADPNDPINRGPKYIGPLPAQVNDPNALPQAPLQFGYAYVTDGQGKLVSRKLPNYRKGALDLSPGVSLVHRGEALINTPKGTITDVIPSKYARPYVQPRSAPPHAPVYSNVTNTTNQQFTWANQYQSAPSSELLDFYGLMAAAKGTLA